MKEKILALLRTSSDYISGQAICEKLGVSRTAVWKNINALKAEGYIIDAVIIKAIVWSESRISLRKRR